MIFFDTHAHMYDKAFDKDRDELLKLLEKLEYKIVCPSENYETSLQSIELSKKFKNLYAAIGIHPYFAEIDKKCDLKKIFDLVKANSEVVAIGEIGLDYYDKNNDREIQKEYFMNQINIAQETDLPVIIHDRKAHGDIFSIIKKMKKHNLRGIMHSFSGSIELANEMIKSDFYISFAGPVAHKNSKRIKEIARIIPLERMLIETDSPYMTPPPFTGQRNTSLNLYYIAKEIAALRNISIEKIIEITYQNAMDIYGLR